MENRVDPATRQAQHDGAMAEITKKMEIERAELKSKLDEIDDAAILGERHRQGLGWHTGPGQSFITGYLG